MRSLLLLWPKPPAIKPLFALNIKADRLGGKVTPSHYGAAPASTGQAVKEVPCGAEKETAVGEWAMAGWRERENQTRVQLMKDDNV